MPAQSMFKYQPISITLDAELLAMLDACVAAEQDKRPESSLSRSEIIRKLLRQALAHVN